MKPPTPQGERPIFYGRRQGRPLKAGRARLVETLLPQLTVPLGAPLDWRALFPTPKRALWLEIGFGGGEHLARQARHHPDVGFIGCEPFANGIAALLAQVAADQLDNVRIHPDDARTLLPLVPDGAVGRCFVLYADPWPKARHARRRFIGPANLGSLARILADGAELRLASDDPGLVDWMLMHVRRHPDFAWATAGAADWRTRPDDWPQTRYEAKALAAGRRPTYLTFRRRPRP